jgi:hypothetical protein
LLPLVFNPFRGTLEKNRGKAKGLGLGLYVARQIALAHGGDLEAQSTEQETVFVLRLPRPRGVHPVEAAARSRGGARRIEHMAAPPSVSGVTAQLFGATPLHERVPLEHAEIVERYRAMLVTAVHRKAYRAQGNELVEEVRALAERLGDLGAGPRRGHRSARARAAPCRARSAELDLVLYVTGTTQESHEAIRNVHRALKPFDKRRFRLTIVDVANGGDEEWCRNLEADRVIVTPTLVTWWKVASSSRRVSRASRGKLLSNPTKRIIF